MVINACLLLLGNYLHPYYICYLLILYFTVLLTIALIFILEKRLAENLVIILLGILRNLKLQVHSTMLGFCVPTELCLAP